MAICKCRVCGREYEYDKKKKRHGKTICNSCTVSKHRRKRKLKMIEYKGGECQICGYNKCPSALVFHHKSPKEKLFGLGHGNVYSWERTKKELDKCVLLCRNCHAELHAAEVHAQE